jgi:hypothetical protein
MFMKSRLIGTVTVRTRAAPAASKAGTERGILRLGHPFPRRQAPERKGARFAGSLDATCFAHLGKQVVVFECEDIVFDVAYDDAVTHVHNGNAGHYSAPL